MRRSFVAASLVVLSCVVLAGCAGLNTGMKSVWEPDQACSASVAEYSPLTPAEAVAFVARSPEQCGSGTFALVVHSTGHVGSVLYLNSSIDPSDPGNLAIAVLPRARAQFAEQFGGLPESHLLGQTIVVTGTVRQAPLPYQAKASFGGASGGWGVPGYAFHGWGKVFAAHVLVTSATDVAVIDAPPGAAPIR